MGALLWARLVRSGVASALSSSSLQLGKMSLPDLSSTALLSLCACPGLSLIPAATPYRVIIANETRVCSREPRHCCGIPYLETRLGFPRSSVGKESACNAGDLGSIPGLGRSPAEGNGNPLQCSYLENPMDREAWQALVHRAPKNQTQLK